MKSADTNPEFWYCWEQLGMAVAVRAVHDYVAIQKRIDRLNRTDEKAYNYQLELRKYRRFFHSKYFAYICPAYDGWELYDRLEQCWRHLPRVHHHPHVPTYKVEDWGKYTGRPTQKRGPKPKTRFGIRKDGGNGV